MSRRQVYELTDDQWNTFVTIPTGSTVTATGLPAGQHVFTVVCEDANGCESTASITVTVNPTPDVSIDPVDQSVKELLPH